MKIYYMKFIIKIAPEISIKSRSVRLNFIKILYHNISHIIKNYDISAIITRYWDRIEVNNVCEQFFTNIFETLSNIPGIHHILYVQEYFWKNIEDIYLYTFEVYHNRLIGKSFCVRVKRNGIHSFTSQDIESYIGHNLKKNIHNVSVNLTKPDEIIRLEIINNRLLLIINRIEGLGGFPIGTQGHVLSLISGGFDSSVSSYMLIRRGCIVHYCFFNFNNIEHEVKVRKIAYHVWNRYSSSHKVHFISINFLPILNEIQEKINSSYMSIVLKRIMFRAASQIAKNYRIYTLVTGESLGQVSSQTLTNLHIINTISNDMLILRPLIAYDKENIINLSRKIGTEELSKTIPEYCGILSKHPTTKAVEKYIKKEEEKFNFSILHTVINQAIILDIRTLLNHPIFLPNFNIETTNYYLEDDIILDIRSEYDQKKNPLLLKNIKIWKLPFYKLHTFLNFLTKTQSYLLYCDHGTISRTQALYLYEKGFNNIKIYHPSSQ